MVAASLGAGGSGEPVPLRYASAVELAKVLQPFLQAGGRIAADPGSNALIVVGDPATREALVGLIRAFDVDTLAGQSYALFPVSGGDVAGTVAALQVAFRSQGGGALANLVRVVPMQAINSVLVIANQPSYIEDARRVFTLVERGRRQSVRAWHVYYLQNSRSNDVAYVLQQAFTPGHVTAVPTPTGSTVPGSQTSRMGGGGWAGGGGLGGGGLGGGGLGGAGAAGRAAAASGAGGGLTASAPGGAQPGQPGGGYSGPGRAGGGQSAAGRSRRRARPDRHLGLHGDDAHHPEQSEQRHPDLRHAGGGRTGRGDAAQDRHPAAAGADRGSDRRGDAQRRSAVRHAVLLQVAQRQHRLQQFRGRTS